MKRNYDATKVEAAVKTWKASRDPRAFRQLTVYFEAGVRRFTEGYRTHPDYEDIVQIATLAIYEALERFDPTRGLAFATLVNQMMKFRINTYLRDFNGPIRIPAYRWEKGERGPEVGSLTGGQGFTPDPGDEFKDMDIPVVYDHEEVVDLLERCDRVRYAVGKLTKAEQLLIRGIFWDEETLASAGDRAGLSRYQARVMRDRAMEKLGRRLKGVAS